MKNEDVLIPDDLKEHLHPFSKDSKCPRCGHDKLGSRYTVQSRTINDVLIYNYDAIKRMCLSCNYNWDELPTEDSL